MNKILIGLILLLVYSGCTLKSDKRKEMAQGKMALTVEALRVIPKQMDYTFSFSGTLLANEEVTLCSEITGRITKINFEEGMPVEKGRLLVKINDVELQAQFKKLMLAEELAAADEVRKKELLKLNAISKEEYDLSLNKMKTLQTDKEMVQAQIAKTKITAPFSGMIGFRSLSEGAYVSPATPIATIQQLNPMKIEFAVPEKISRYIASGDTIVFSIEGNDHTYVAVVSALESKIAADTRTLKVHALCENKKNGLVPGAFIIVKWDMTRKKKSMVIPAKALVPVLEGQKVFILQQGLAKSISVKTGLRMESEVEISEGLNENDTLILSGLLQLKEGMPVKAVIK